MPLPSGQEPMLKNSAKFPDGWFEGSTKLISSTPTDPAAKPMKLIVSAGMLVTEPAPAGPRGWGAHVLRVRLQIR